MSTVQSPKRTPIVLIPPVASILQQQQVNPKEEETNLREMAEIIPMMLRSVEHQPNVNSEPKPNWRIPRWLSSSLVPEWRCSHRTEKVKNNVAFTGRLRAVIGNKWTVRTLVPKASVEIRDLDLGLSWSSETHLRTWLPKPNRIQHWLAVLELRKTHANRLLALQHLRVSCRIRRRVIVPRCSRSLGFWHAQIEQTHVFLYGDEDHKSQGYQALYYFLKK
ncbi:hypothetical protein J6590_037291 [Homalodisca vitripennis]|nr:hypothetical protein J6590_037291 [Homalodisca vitripennis]